MTAPPGKKMGHAGAIVSGRQGHRGGEDGSAARRRRRGGSQPHRGRRADGRGSSPSSRWRPSARAPPRPARARRGRRCRVPCGRTRPCVHSYASASPSRFTACCPPIRYPLRCNARWISGSDRGVPARTRTPSAAYRRSRPLTGTAVGAGGGMGGGPPTRGRRTFRNAWPGRRGHRRSRSDCELVAELAEFAPRAERCCASIAAAASEQIALALEQAPVGRDTATDDVDDMGTGRPSSANTMREERLGSCGGGARMPRRCDSNPERAHTRRLPRRTDSHRFGTAPIAATDSARVLHRIGRRFGPMGIGRGGAGPGRRVRQAAAASGSVAVAESPPGGTVGGGTGS